MSLTTRFSPTPSLANSLFHLGEEEMDTRDSILGASSGTGIIKAKWTAMFYVCEDPLYDELIMAFATIKINKGLKVLVSPIVLRAREFVEALVINCIYYVTQLPDLGQSDINKLMFLNAARENTDPANVASYSKRNGGLGRMLKDAVRRPVIKSEYFERVFPVLRKWFRHTEPVSDQYLAEVWSAYVGNPIILEPEFVNVDVDFKKVAIYLIMSGKMKLTGATVLRYINGNFCPIEFVLNQLVKGLRLRENLSL